jgi:tetratricopeptide (TPR) repeat protein
VVGEALRARIGTKDKLDAFVASLRGGEVDFEDEATEGRTKSLGASLSYGFASAFNENERKQLALLHLFQGFVDVGTLRWMGLPDADWALDTVRGLTREQGIGLLDRAAEIGLLVPRGDGLYNIHPALPWYFRDLFERYYPGDKADRAKRAFVEAIGTQANYYDRQYGAGNRHFLQLLMGEEDNLLAAWRQARRNGWWGHIIDVMQGLQILYTETGRAPAWRRLVAAVIPYFVDLDTDLPLPGREDEWSFVTEYRIHIFREERDLKAERLQRLCVDWFRKRATVALETMPERRNDIHRNEIRSLAVHTNLLGEIQRANNDPACVESYRESFALAQSAADQAGQARIALNLGKAHMDIVQLCNYDEAERWLQQSLDLRPNGDALGRGRSMSQLGRLARLHFDEASTATRSEEKRLRLINKAARLYQEALQILPQTAIGDRALSLDGLGVVYSSVGELDGALQYWQESIRYNEQAGDIFEAGLTRYNVALGLLGAGRFADARAYAEAALANFQNFRTRAAAEVQEAERLLARIDALAAQQQEQI